MARRAYPNPRGSDLEVFDIAACAALMERLTAIATRAAATIRQCGPGLLRQKADGSPVTAADEAAETVILQGLEQLAPQIPVISEERSAAEQVSASSVSTYFLVDPLDGTREFVSGRDEFTVNIALIDAGAPILGIVTAPAVDVTWRGIVGGGAELTGKGTRTAIRTRRRPAHPVVMISRSHLDADTKAYLANLAGGSAVSCGSSMKFCRIAEGSADVYPRLSPTHDWDVAAGHAIVVAAGGDVRTAGGSALIYDTPQRLIPDFIARGDASAE